MRAEDERDPLFLFLTDIHFSGQKPRWRLGNYPADILEKVREVGRVAKTNHVPRVIIGGDLTESCLISLELGDALVDAIEGWGLPTYVVVGNHDLFGNSYKTLHRTWLAHVLRRSKSISRLRRLYDGEVAIRAIHFDEGVETFLASQENVTDSVDSLYQTKKILDADGNSTGEEQRVKVANRLIDVVHAMIVPKSLPGESSRQILIKDVNTRADLVLSGDYHKGWPDAPRRMDGTVFVNPGALARKTVDEGDYNRTVQIALVRRDLSVEFVPLQTARPTAEAFDVDGAVAHKAWESSVTSQIEGLQSIRTDLVDIRQRIEELAVKNETEPRVKTLALERYDEAQGAET